MRDDPSLMDEISFIQSLDKDAIFTLFTAVLNERNKARSIARSLGHTGGWDGKLSSRPRVHNVLPIVELTADGDKLVAESDDHEPYEWRIEATKVSDYIANVRIIINEADVFNIRVTEPMGDLSNTVQYIASNLLWSILFDVDRDDEFYYSRHLKSISYTSRGR
jgi:hypothetical protein